MQETESFRLSRTSFYKLQVRRGLLSSQDVPEQYRSDGKIRPEDFGTPRKGVCKWCDAPTLGTWTVCRDCESKNARDEYLRRREVMLQKTLENIRAVQQESIIGIPISQPILNALYPKQKIKFPFYKRPGYCKVCDISLTGRFGVGGSDGMCREHSLVQVPQSNTG